MKGSENPFPSVNMEEILSDGSTLSNADADFRRLFLGEDGALHLKDAAGAVTSVGAGNVATDAIWDAAGDLAVGTGANTAAKLTKGSDDDVLTISASTHLPVWAAPAASSGSRPYLDENPTLSGTYGDDFDGASLDGKWTLGADLVAGDITYQQGDGSQIYINIASNSTSTADVIYQTSAPGSDFSVYTSMTWWFANAGGGTSNMMFGPGIIDSSGTGVAAVMYQGAIKTITLTSYKYALQKNAITVVPSGYEHYRRTWIRLRKSGTDYYASMSWDGINWSAESAAYSDAFTVARLIVGCYYNNGGQHTLAIGHFNAA